MFYSQFILAKKGPLGTIWIAAHLERKLRKNQVADTDIGVSVDSILFPEVPIALRLSSHLLLGVVRIYSRKVNYLFHDCSEALLKIKQAFRSTAVDLPPEESTAPYHSITLPETFDLDDFELPDNAFFHGNYVDHHVSTREQITLQDSMEGMVYSTSQFGLDERFGDGDASQIGLDLDEDLFLEKVSSSGHASASLGIEKDVDPQTSGQQVMFTDMDIDGGEATKSQPDLLAGGCGDHNDSNILDSKGADDSSHLHNEHIQTPDLNEEILPREPIVAPFADAGVLDFACNSAEVRSSDMTECAQAPSTPGLMTEAVPSLSLLKKTSLHNAVESVINKSDLEHVITDSTKLIPEENLANPLKTPDYHIEGIKHAPDCTSPNDKSCETDTHPVQNMENESPGGIQQNIHVKHPEEGLSPSGGQVSSELIQSVSSPTSVLSERKSGYLATECSGGHLVAPDELSLKHELDRTGILENGALCSEATEHQADPLDVITVSPGCSIEGSNLQPSYNKPKDGVETVNYDSLKGSQAIKNVDNPDSVTNVGPVDAVVDSCPSSSALQSDANFQLGLIDKQEIENPCARVHVLQACSTSVDQHSALPLEERILVENAPDLSTTEAGSHPIVEQETVALHVDAAPDEVQGEVCHSADVMDTNLEVQQMRVPLPSEIDKADECLDGFASKDNQLGSLNGSTSSEFPAPETLLLAPAVVSDSPNDLALQYTAGKPATEGEGTVDRFDSLSGKKRRLMESTPMLDTDNSSKLSEVPRSRRSMGYIPDDDDVLASILVGKRTPLLKMRPTPPPAEVLSSKRARVTPRVSVLKRKVLLDDIMVLHGDAIRKQLTNTEDIRRIRRKAPCTQKEILMIQKYLLEEEIFSEPLFTGMSAVLTNLQNQAYDLTETGVSPIVAKQSSLEALEELELSEGPEFVKETGVQGIEGSITAMPDKNDGAEREPTTEVVQIENQQSEHAICSLGSYNQDQTEATMEIDVHDKGASDVENQAAPIGVEMPILIDPLRGDDCNVSDLRVESSCMDKIDGTETTPLKDDGSCLSPDQKLPSPYQKLAVEPANGLMEMNDERLKLMDKSLFEKDAPIVGTEDWAIGTNEVNYETSTLDKGIARDESFVDEAKGGISLDVVPPSSPQDYNDGFREVTKDEILVPLPDNCSVGTGVDVLTDSLTTNMDPSVPDVTVESDGFTDMAIVTDDKGISGVSNTELGVVVEDEDMAKTMTNGEGNLLSTLTGSEEPQIASSLPLLLNPEMDNEFSNGGEGPSCQEGQQDSAMDTEIPVMVISSEGDHGDFGYLLDENDTEFLNADDEAEPVEEDDNNMPTAEEGRFIENSGWSSRTRAVARYLRSLFDDEAGRGIKTVPMDNLLAGKTRKEASRMFFETLVLKTRDYIQVEQENPYEKINIQPRVKLMKSEF